MEILRIASMNICGGRGHIVQPNDPDYALKYITTLACKHDVVCLQEVVQYRGGPANRFLAMRNPGHFNAPIDLLLEQILTRQLKRTHYVCFNEHFAGGFHDYQATDMPVSFGNLMLVKRSVPLIGSCLGYRIYGQNNLNTQTPDGHLGRSAARTSQLLAIRWGGGALLLQNIHGLHSRSGKGDLPSRTAQSAAIAQAFIRHRRKYKLTDTQSIAIGDFNYLSDQEAMQQLLARHEVFGLEGAVNLNTYFEIGTDARTEFYPADKPNREASHTVIPRSLLPSVVEYKHEAEGVPSDHKVMLLGLRT